MSPISPRKISNEFLIIIGIIQKESESKYFTKISNWTKKNLHFAIGISVCCPVGGATGGFFIWLYIG